MAQTATTLPFPEDLKAERERRRWTQPKAADECGVQLRTYQHWEAGTKSPSFEALPGIARAFGPDLVLRHVNQSGWTVQPALDLELSGAA